MLVAKNIYKSFGDLEVLKGVSLNIEKGEVISIVGESGAGKTTLLQIIGTLENPTDAQKNNTEIIIDNQNITHLGDKELSDFRNKNIGFIFQFHHLLPEFSAIENVMMPAIIGKIKKSESKERAKYLLDFLKLNDRLNHFPNQLSGGEQQRVAVARALMNNPKIIFADEPSGNLDSKNAEDLHKLFFELKNEFNQTFVIVTHNISLAEMSDRVLKMSDGKIDKI